MVDLSWNAPVTNLIGSSASVRTTSGSIGIAEYCGTAYVSDSTRTDIYGREQQLRSRAAQHAAGVFRSDIYGHKYELSCRAAQRIYVSGAFCRDIYERKQKL